jgi:hypothetical protein
MHRAKYLQKVQAREVLKNYYYEDCYFLYESFRGQLPLISHLAVRAGQTTPDITTPSSLSYCMSEADIFIVMLGMTAKIW